MLIPLLPPALTTTLRNVHSLRFELVLREQPVQGRVCGGTKDRRPIDPVPILQLHIYTPQNDDLMAIERTAEDQGTESTITIDAVLSALPPLVVQATLLTEAKDDAMAIRTTNSHSTRDTAESSGTGTVRRTYRRTLEGKLVASAHVARDLDGHRACFFFFPDLSIRLEGRFRLRFQLLTVPASSYVFSFICPPLLHVQTVILIRFCEQRRSGRTGCHN